MLLNSLRYFGFVDLRDFERMTVKEYGIRMTAVALKKLDQQEFIHRQAWANWQVQSTKTQGRKEIPVYSTFKKFFDKEKIENEIRGIKKPSQDKKLVQLMKKANK